MVVQPNIDPYEKVSDDPGSFDAQMQKLITTSEKQMTATPVVGMAGNCFVYGIGY